MALRQHTRMIANVYLNKRATTDKALDFFLKALHLSEKTGDKIIIGGSSVNLGEIYRGINKYGSQPFSIIANP